MNMWDLHLLPGSNRLAGLVTNAINSKVQASAFFFLELHYSSTLEFSSQRLQIGYTNSMYEVSIFSNIYFVSCD